jgi:hypothetical protein
MMRGHLRRVKRMSECQPPLSARRVRERLVEGLCAH